MMWLRWVITILTLESTDLDMRSNLQNSLLCAATMTSKKTSLVDHTRPYHIVKRGGLKIGFFGIGVNLEGLSPATCWKGMEYLDPIERANTMAQLLSDLGCDLVVCLSHLGFEYTSKQLSHKVLAAQTAHIHLILGGHTHTFMEKPLIVENANKQPFNQSNGMGWVVFRQN